MFLISIFCRACPLHRTLIFPQINGPPSRHIQITENSMGHTQNHFVLKRYLNNIIRNSTHLQTCDLKLERGGSEPRKVPDSDASCGPSRGPSVPHHPVPGAVPPAAHGRRAPWEGDWFGRTIQLAMERGGGGPSNHLRLFPTLSSPHNVLVAIFVFWPFAQKVF